MILTTLLLHVIQLLEFVFTLPHVMKEHKL